MERRKTARTGKQGGRKIGKNEGLEGRWKEGRKE